MLATACSIGTGPAALTEGVAGLSRFTIKLMQPVLPMLAEPAANAAEAVAGFGTALLVGELRRRSGGRASAG